MTVLTASTIYDSIAAAHTAPEWAVFSEVSDATGGRASRRADALALNLWPSRGLEIRGFEIKISRSDLKRELNDPSKADAIGKYCHTWCLATPIGLIKESDPVPSTWGIFEADSGSGVFKRMPTTRPADEVKVPTRLFVAAIVRAAHAEIASVRSGGDWVRSASIQEEIDKAYQRGQKDAPNEHEAELRELKAKLGTATALLDPLVVDFSNGNFHKLDADRYAQALKLGLAITSSYGRSAAEIALRDINRAIETLKASAESLSELSLESIK